MKVNFCTLFNSAYFSRGMALYDSLVKNCADFHLFIFAFDDDVLKFFATKQFSNITVISLLEFEDEKLLEVKPDRTKAEYCWTCTPSTILYVLEKFSLSNCVYIDADMIFYNDPKVLIDEWGEKDVLITEHRYTPKYDQSQKSGIYCVQFVGFKNTVKGLKALKYWRNACIDWCYARFEDGKFGDQKYLDDWTTRFESVHVLQHLGGGLAPWNIQQYAFNKSTNDQVIGVERKTGIEFKPVFYHFHSLKFYNLNIVAFCDSGYEIDENVKKLFYRSYVKKLESINNSYGTEFKNLNHYFNSKNSEVFPFSLTKALSLYKEHIKESRRNVLGQKTVDELFNHHQLFVSEI